MIRIIGGRGNIDSVEDCMKRILAFSQRHNISVQILNADMVFGTQHLYSAAEHALRAIREKRNTTNSLAMEVLLYASGERQIKLSLKKMGVKTGKQNVAFVLIGEGKHSAKASHAVSDDVVELLLQTLQFKRDDKVLEGDRNTLKQFGVTQQEMETVDEAHYGHLILEKVALVDVIK